MGRLKKLSKKRFIELIIIISFFLILAVLIFCNLLVGSFGKYIVTDQNVLKENLSGLRAGIVFGGGINENMEPTDIVKARLDATVELYDTGVIDKILVSGDNRFVNYNEPQVMQDYLVTVGNIPAHDIQQDNAGRSTYETCERANKIFGLNEAVLISQNSHLPRAIFLCRSFGIKSYGYPAKNQTLRLSQSMRELGANVKAVFNVYIVGEKTVLGEPIKF